MVTIRTSGRSESVIHYVFSFLAHTCAIQSQNYHGTLSTCFVYRSHETCFESSQRNATPSLFAHFIMCCSDLLTNFQAISFKRFSVHKSVKNLPIEAGSLMYQKICGNEYQSFCQKPLDAKRFSLSSCFELSDDLYILYPLTYRGK